MSASINFSRFGLAPYPGFSIPARRAEFCWTPRFLVDQTTAGEFVVLRKRDLACLDFSLTWGASFTYWSYLPDVDLLAEVLAIGLHAIVEYDVPARRVVGELLRVPEVRRCARGNYVEFAEASRVHKILATALQSIAVDGVPAIQVVASLRRDRAVRMWMRNHPDYVRK